MELNKVKKLAAQILKVGLGRVYIDPAKAEKAKEAMTKDDIRGLISERIVQKRPLVNQSRGRARVLAEKKKKGRKSGHGKRKGTKKTRTEKKKTWIGRVRAQRSMLKEMKKENPDAVKELGYGDIYKKIKGNYFKGKNYVKDYIEGGKTK
jgi:large subunit ribosomal protein L19e